MAILKNTKLQYAGFWTRLLAYGADFAILSLLNMTVSNLLGYNSLAVLKATTVEELATLSKAPSSVLISGIAIALFYYVFFLVNSDGATIGKKLMGIRIISGKDKSLTYATALIRYFSQFISGMAFMLGYLWIAIDGKKQGWHDKIANTFVVKTGAKPRTILATILTVVILLFWLIILNQLYSQLKLIKVKSTISSALDTGLNSDMKTLSPDAKAHLEKANADINSYMSQASADKNSPLLKDAETEYLSALQTDGSNGLLWYRLSYLYSTMGKNNEALNAALKAVEVNPAVAEYHTNLGYTYYYLGDDKEAVKSFSESLRIDDTDARTHLGIARAYKGLGVKEEAITHYEKAIAGFEKYNDNGEFDDYLINARVELSKLK